MTGELPNGWKLEKLEDVVDILDSKRVPINSKERETRQGPIPYYGATGQVGWIDDFLFDEELVLLGEDGAPFFDSAKQKAYVIRGKSWVNNHAHVLRAKNGIPNAYIKYYLDIVDYHGFVTGTTRHKLNQAAMRQIPIPVAPPDQQKRIVAEIEKQFSRLDEAVANLKRVKANLKRYKAAVLKAAVEGRLVETEAELARREGRSYETGEQLLQRILETRCSQWQGKGKYKEPAAPDTTDLPELPEGWVWSTYEQLGRLQLGRQRAPKYHTGPNMRPYLRVQNVFEDRIDLSDVMEMDFPPSDFEKYQLAPGDLLLNEGQSPELLGRPAIYRGELPGACFTNTLIRFRAAEGVSVEFALHVSRHNMLAGRFVDEGTITTNIAHLSLGRLATVEFPLPPTAEQNRIVLEVERRLSLVRTVEAEVDANLKRADRLRQAVLARSFDTGSRAK
jgi:type I restriction enzyme S subunit